MASFFQPADLYSMPSCDTRTIGQPTRSRFLTYSNTVLPIDSLLATRHQFVVFGIGVVLFLLPLIRWTVRLLKSDEERDKKRPQAEQRKDLSVKHGNQTQRASKTFTKPIKSFGVFLSEDEDIDSFLKRRLDLHIVNLANCRSSGLLPSPSARARILEDGSSDICPQSNIWGLVQFADWQAIQSTSTTPQNSIQALASIVATQSLAGLVVATSIVTDATNLSQIVHLLVNSNISCILLDDIQGAASAINTSHLSGVIYQNACILNNGTRRDFFQAYKLRDALGRCESVRSRNKNFFVGFLDWWTTRPLPAVVRRGHKLAEFNNAVLVHAEYGKSGAWDESNSNGTCLSAFDWIKRADVIQAQKVWQSTATPLGPFLPLLPSMLDIQSLEPLLPGISSVFGTLQVVAGAQTNKLPQYHDAPGHSFKCQARADFWTVSSQGKELSQLGCYDLRDEVFAEQYFAVLDTQKHLERLEMLEPLSAESRSTLCETLITADIAWVYKTKLLDLASGIKSGKIRILRGLDSGYTLPDRQAHFWGVSHAHKNDALSIYVSLKAPDLISTIVHVYLAHREVGRRTRIDVEMAVLGGNDNESQFQRHPRLNHEIKSATPAELLFLIQQIAVSGSEDALLKLVQVACEKELIEETTKSAWNKYHSQGLLSKSTGMEDVLRLRLDAFVRGGADQVPNLIDLVDLSCKINDAMDDALFENDEAKMLALSQPIFAQKSSSFDHGLDLYRIMFLSSLRRHAFEEIYLETTDRCPLFLQQADQAAVFAELWVLGSQCDIYFGIRPRALGAVIYDEYREYLKDHLPLTSSWNGKDVFTSYHKISVSSEPQASSNAEGHLALTATTSLKTQLAEASFLTIFCVPAIVDVVLLTFVGRGLYLTAWMEPRERLMANYAVLASLAMTAWVTGWSGSTGGFYLHQSAFHSMNLFMAQQILGGFVLAMFLGLWGSIAFGIKYSWYAGFIFFAYLIVVSTFLNIMGVMSTMHREKTPFKSGRLVMSRCMCILLVSPILTSFFNGHDVVIYLVVLYVFLGVLLRSYTRLCREWSNWPEKVKLVKESEIADWYESKASASVTQDNAARGKTTHIASKAAAAVMKAIDRRLRQDKTECDSDYFIKELAESHKYVVWLLQKESGGQPLPAPYSSTWLVQTKLALTNQQQLNRGLKEHSPFLLYRAAKNDIAQNVGLFLVAMLDRWVAVSTSTDGQIASMHHDSRERYALAFGLLYFLFCSVSLDVVIQRFRVKSRNIAQKLESILDLEWNVKQKVQSEKRRWVSAISEMIWVALFFFGFLTIMVWLMVSDPRQLVLFFAHVLGYSGVIIFQFNRVFTTDVKVHVQIIFGAAIVGYILGVGLYGIQFTQNFRFDEVAAQVSASLMGALGTWWFTDFCDDPSRGKQVANEDDTNWKVYSQRLLGKEQALFRNGVVPGDLQSLKGTTYAFDDGSKVSEGIKAVFLQGLSKSVGSVHENLTRSKEMLKFALDTWAQKRLRLILVHRSSLATIAGGNEVFAASTWVEDRLFVYVGMPTMQASRVSSEEHYELLLAQISAEALLHETCEAFLSLPHSHAVLAELLLNEDAALSTRMILQLAWSSRSELFALISNTNYELFRHLCLGIDANTEWLEMPEAIRIFVVSRMKGLRHPKGAELQDWLEEREQNVGLYDQYITQCLAVQDKALSMLKQHIVSPVEADELQLMPQDQGHVWNATQVKINSSRGSTKRPLRMLQSGYTFLCDFFMLVAILCTAGTDFGRELWYLIRGCVAADEILSVVLKIWKLCWWVKSLGIHFLILSMRQGYKEFYDWTIRGASRTLSKGKISVRDPRYHRTGFLVESGEGFEMEVFDGFHERLPIGKKEHQVAEYDHEARLLKLATMINGVEDTEQTQEYRYDNTSPNHRIPLLKVCRVGSETSVICYDKYGRITHGTSIRKGIRFYFTYHYKHAPEDNNHLIRAAYRSMNTQHPISFAVDWYRATNSKVSDVSSLKAFGKFRRLTINNNHSIQEVTWTWDHKCDPIIVRREIKQGSETFQKPEYLQEYLDEYDILQKPFSTSFTDEDILFYHSKKSIFKAVQSSMDDVEGKSAQSLSQNRFFSQYLSGFWSSSQIQHVPRRFLSTAALRTALWKQWEARTDMDAVTTCLLDELMLRKEPSLTYYWRLRDAGHFIKAREYLATHLDLIISSVEISHDVSQKISLAIKSGDLFAMGLAKDSNFVCAKPNETYIDTDTRVAVLFTDTGCWPDAPGGVSNCRRDLIDGHNTVRNYGLIESANEYGIQRFQAEKSVQTIKNLPLWGLDGKSAYHGLFDNLLQTQVNMRVRQTRGTEDIIETFIPLLRAVVRGARTLSLSKKDIFEFTNTFLNIQKYFEENDYVTTWRSKAVQNAWREAWLCAYADDNIKNPSDAFQIEIPTARHFDEALELYVSYFFIFSVKVPENVPRVYQSTHHGISSLYGMILKLRRGTTWGIWDHAIMWRESCLNLSPAQCLLPIPVQTMLLGAIRLASNLAYHHADIILPCTVVFNPVWEAELGTDSGHRSNQALFSRKVDPITNGISNMDTFKPIETIKTTDPTVVMLSNVQFIKGVKTAIMAAGVIINDFGFKNYNLVVYGAQDRQPSYAIESAQMISDLGIGKTVRLGGFGSPREALKDAWLFMNSSLSEGLPLAVGEAALLGIPIVATDVGATAQVLTDVDDPSILYGEVVPPNDPIGLARAQISMLAMVGPWAKFTSDDFAPPPLPVTFTPEDVIWLEQRMHDKMKDRRKLGLRLRDVVIRKFNGTRYLREHEQMYWVQRHMAAQRADTRLINLSASHPRVGETLHLRLVEMEDTNSMWKEQGWQHFGQKVSKMDVVLERLRKNSADHKSEFCEDSKVRKRDSMLGSKIKTSLE